MSRRFSSNDLKHMDTKRLGPMLADSLAQFPIAPLGQSASYMLLPSPTKGPLGGLFFNEGNADIRH